MKVPKKNQNSPAVASAKTYYACRRIVADQFNIEPQKGSTARLAFEATILFLIRDIEAGRTAKGASPTKTARDKVAIGIEFFSQEQIINALEEARQSFVENDVLEISRKELITQA